VYDLWIYCIEASDSMRAQDSLKYISRVVFLGHCVKMKCPYQKREGVK
jgi:hypothetical protein